MSQVRVEALREIIEQLRYAPAPVLRKHIEQAEALAEQLDPQERYPLEWVLFRLTGYRSDQTQGLVTGDALLGDLSSMVEHLCVYAKLRPEEVGPHLTLDELAQRWSVSTKTIERYRRSGLIARRVIDQSRARARLVFTEQVVSAFETKQRVALEKAGGFTRMGAEAEERVVRRARRYQHRLGWSRTQTIERLAMRTGRSGEAIRLLLLRANPPVAQPALNRRALVHAWREGVGSSELCARFGMNTSSLQRELLAWRREKLAEATQAINLPEGWHRQKAPAAAAEDHLRPEIVRAGLDTGGPTELGMFLEIMQQRIVPIGAQEQLLGRAMVALRARAQDGANQSPETIADLDLIETDLRWASRLKATLARPMLGVMGSQLRELLGPAANRLRTEEWRSLLAASLSAVSAGLDRWDPWSQGRPAGAVTLAVGRAATRWLSERPRADRPGQASQRIDADAKLPDWSLGLDRWQTWLELPPQTHEGMATLDPEARKLLAARFGLNGTHPHTAHQLATHHNSTARAIERRVRTAVREAIAIAQHDSSGEGVDAQSIE